MESQVLHTVWCNISGVAAGEIMALITLKSERVEEKYGSRLVAGHVPPTRSLKLALPLTQSLLQTYNPGQKYMVHLENLPCFHYRPLFDDKSGSFSHTWPSPLYNVASRGTLWVHWPNIVWGGGGREWWNCPRRPSVPLLLARIVDLTQGRAGTWPATEQDRIKPG